MKKTIVALLATLALTAGTAHALPTLFEWRTWSSGGLDDIAMTGVNTAGFDATTGLGSISMTFTSSGFGGLYVDHEFSEGANTFFNEYGSIAGVAPAGLSWEIDEPGFVFGDIYTNFAAGALDNGNGVPEGSDDDVSMALGWDFSLASGESALIRFMLSTTAPTSGFYLAQFDQDSNESIYFSSTLDIRGGGTPPVPEPSTIVLLGAGLAGVALYGRKRRND